MRGVTGANGDARRKVELRGPRSGRRAMKCDWRQVANSTPAPRVAQARTSRLFLVCNDMHPREPGYAVRAVASDRCL